MEEGGFSGLALVLTGLLIIWQVARGNALTRLGFLPK